ALSPPYQPLSPPNDYVSAPPPPTQTTTTSSLTPISSLGHSPSKILLTPTTTPPPLSSPPPDPTQPSKLATPHSLTFDPIELLFSTPPTSLRAFLDSLGDLPPSTTNPSPSRPSFDTIERMANEPPPIPTIECTFPSPTPTMAPTSPPPLPSQPTTLPPSNLPSDFPPSPTSIYPPLPPLGPNNPFPMLIHEMFCEHCQQTQVIVDKLQGEMRFILNHILDLLNVLAHKC
ncbi:hypothetical protein Tco_0691053, partial [Tanacetum coccineum]